MRRRLPVRTIVGTVGWPLLTRAQQESPIIGETRLASAIERAADFLVAIGAWQTLHPRYGQVRIYEYVLV